MGLFVVCLLFTNPVGAQELHQTEHGSYVELGASHPRRIVVLLHGSLGERESATDVAMTMAKHWSRVARRHRLLVLVPAFDQRNFGGRAGPFGGYRGMFGRHIGADHFLHEVLKDVRKRHLNLAKKFYLYGHSAGGQMVSRYLVAHPDRVSKAVISASGTFAFPDANLPWTDGMATIDRDYVWSPGDSVEHFTYRPKPRGWLRASQVPTTVLVGDRDRTPIPMIPGLPKDTILGRAKHWVRSMRKHAREHGKTSRVRLKIVRGADHDSRKLLPAAYRAFFGSNTPKPK